MAEKRFIVEVEKATEAREGKPPIGPVYRSIFAHDPLPPPIQGLNTCWDIFSYKRCFLLNLIILKLGKKYSGLRSLEEQYLNLHMLQNLLDCLQCSRTLSCSLIRYLSPNIFQMIVIMDFDMQGLWNLLYAMQRSRWHLLKKRRYLSFLCLEQGHNQSFDLPVKKKSDVCTIMYTSGTTGDPKGVLITNESIITLLAGIQQLLKSCNEKLNEKDVYLSYLPLAHIFARVIEEAMIMHGASIGFWSGDVSVTGRYWRAKANHFCCGSPCAR
ncbi:hypothetical protein JHK85_020693 [Glycine max]|nr:hypothetical protein JHK85_020693 [Glycine max]